MKRNNWLYFFLFIPALISMGLASCQKEEEVDNNVKESWLAATDGKTWNVLQDEVSTVMMWVDSTGKKARTDSVLNSSPRFHSYEWTFYLPKTGMSVRMDSTYLDSVFSRRTQTFEWKDLNDRMVIRNISTFDKAQVDTFNVTKVSPSEFSMSYKYEDVTVYDTLYMDVTNDGVKDTLTNITRTINKTRNLRLQTAK